MRAFETAMSASLAAASRPWSRSKKCTSKTIAVPAAARSMDDQVLPRSSEKMRAEGPPTRAAAKTRTRSSRLPALTNFSRSASIAHSPTTAGPSIFVTGVQVGPAVLRAIYRRRVGDVRKIARPDVARQPDVVGGERNAAEEGADLGGELVPVCTVQKFYDTNVPASPLRP